MAIIFQEDWSAGNFSNWEVPGGPIPSSFQIQPVGCNGGNAFTCSYTSPSNTDATLARVLTGYASGYAGLNIRTIYAMYAAIAFGSVLILFVNNFYDPISSTSVQFQAYLLLNDTGGLTLRIYDNTTPHDFTSAGSIVPLNGTPHAYQLRLQFSAHNTVVYEVVVDNVSVLSGTFSATTIVCLFPDRTPWAYGHPGSFSCADYVPFAGVSTVEVSVQQSPGRPCVLVDFVSANLLVEVDDDPTIISFLPCTAPTIGVDTCSCAPPPVTGATVGTVGINCATNTVTITGVNFAVGASIDVQDPNGNPVTFTLISFSATQITIRVAYTIPGTYTVTVTNQ